jgi:predicted phage terminase large subunit-like protein
MQASNTGELAVGFGRKVRNLVMSEQYHKVFPDTNLRSDSKAAGRWAVTEVGEYFAIGVGGTMTGRGADLVIIDDPHTEGEAASAAHDPSVYDRAYEWYTSGPRQRLQPGGAIIIVATRWGENDLIGRVLEDANERGKPDEWRVIEFPAILPSGNPLWPEFWPLDQLQALKEELAPAKWNAQYQQQPTGEEGAIVKREWWKIWELDEPPRCEFVIQAWDTAFTKNERSDYSACTTWGIFHLNENPDDVNIILLDSFQKRMEFPELKEKARAHYMEWQPDDCIIEAKAAGASLIQELNQQSDLFVRGYTPSRGTRQQSNDKIARMNTVAPIFQSGKVWAPDTRWARELIDQMASFPNSAHDDLADTAVMAVTRFRQGGFLRLESDERDEVQGFRRKTAFY